MMRKLIVDLAEVSSVGGRREKQAIFRGEYPTGLCHDGADGWVYLEVAFEGLMLTCLGVEARAEKRYMTKSPYYNDAGKL